MVARLPSVQVVARSNPSKLSILPLLKYTCKEVTSWDAGHQEIGRYSTRGGSWGNVHYVHFCKSARSNPSKLSILPLLKYTCKEVTSWDAGHQEIGRYSTRGGSWGMYIMYTSAKVNKAEPTLALKPRGEITRNPKQGYQ